MHAPHQWIYILDNWWNAVCIHSNTVSEYIKLCACEPAVKCNP